MEATNFEVSSEVLKKMIREIEMSKSIHESAKALIVSHLAAVKDIVSCYEA